MQFTVDLQLQLRVATPVLAHRHGYGWARRRRVPSTHATPPSPSSHFARTCGQTASHHSPVGTFVRRMIERLSDVWPNVRAMTNPSKDSGPLKHTSSKKPREQLVQPSASLANRYRTACRDELALVTTFYRHPVAARTRRPGALDHMITLPETNGDTATIRTHRVRVPTGLVRDLSLRYPKYLKFNGRPVYLFTASILLGLHDDRPTPLAGPVHARAIAEALHSEQDAANIYPNGTDPASGAFRYSWIGDQEGRVFTSPPELFTAPSQAA